MMLCNSWREDDPRFSSDPRAHGTVVLFQDRIADRLLDSWMCVMLET